MTNEHIYHTLECIRRAVAPDKNERFDMSPDDTTLERTNNLVNGLLRRARKDRKNSVLDYGVAVLFRNSLEAEKKGLIFNKSLVECVYGLGDVILSHWEEDCLIDVIHKYVDTITNEVELYNKGLV